MKQALGLVEIQGLSTAITAADAMVKAANVCLEEVENTRGLGYITIKVTGDVGAVNAAVDVGRQVGTMNGKLVSYKVIPRPSDYVDKFFVEPARKDNKKAEPEMKKAEPEAKKAEPEIKKAEPETKKAEPETKKAEPEIKKAEPVIKKAEPEVKKPEPAKKAEPEAKKTEPPKKK